VHNYIYVKKRPVWELEVIYSFPSGLLLYISVYYIMEAIYMDTDNKTYKPRQAEPQYLDLESRESELLYAIGKIFTSTSDMEELMHNVLTLLVSHLGIERGAISIHHETTDDFFVDASFGYTDDEVSRGRYRAGEGITGSVISSGKPLVVPSIDSEPLFLNKTGAKLRNTGQNMAFMCVPIILENRVIGTISIDKYKKADHSFLEELRTLSAVSVMIAHAVNTRREMVQQETRLEEENRLLKIKLSGLRPGNILGNSHIMQELYEKIMLVAPTTSTVLITGESGTGKELIANALFENSPRRNKPFVKVNIAALPENLIESELFGHEKGAFTGASSLKKGRFEMADGGTIFLDEIGDLHISLQVKLLRVIQERNFERIGGTRPLPLDVRVIAATHQNLEEKIARKEFREDLYYRLNVFPLFVPPLRERKADIMLLADHFLEKYNKEFNKNISRISSEAIDMLVSYHWPGNVRELENAIQRAAILSNEMVIRSYHLPPSLQMADDTTEGIHNLEEMINQYAREIIIDHLKITRGNITRAATLLGTTTRILNYRVKTLGIDYTRYRTPAP